MIELHTLGLGPDLSWQGKKLYTQADVEASSLILTGINIFNGLNKENEYEYGTVINPFSSAPDYVIQKIGNTSKEIETAPVVMGKKFCLLSGKVVDHKQSCAKPASPVELSSAVKNRLSNYLKFLANHDRTKENICRKLSSILVAPSFETYPDGPRTEVAIKAVSENCIKAWGTDGDLKAIYKAILQSPEVWNKSNYSRFTKNPLDLVISAARTMGITAKDLKNLVEIKTFAETLNNEINYVGLPYRTWMTPTGYNQTSGWLNQSYLVRWTESAFKILNHFEHQTALQVTNNTNGTKVTERYAPIMGLHPTHGYLGSLEEQCNKLPKNSKRPGYEKCQYVYQVLGYGNVRRNVFRIEELIRKALDDSKLVGKQWIPGDDRKKPREIVPVKTGTLLNTTSLEFMRK